MTEGWPPLVRHPLFNILDREMLGNELGLDYGDHSQHRIQAVSVPPSFAGKAFGMFTFDLISLL